MKYVSTRGAAPVLDFVDVMLTGLASDGGLYVPAAWPALPSVSAEAPYADTTTEVIWPYVDGVSRSELATASVEAYATFDHPAVCPLVELAPNTWLLELFHGPTLAFKDVALQLLARLLDAEPERRGHASRSCSQPLATRALPRSRPVATGRTSTSSCSTRRAACRRYSAGR